MLPQMLIFPVSKIFKILKTVCKKMQLHLLMKHFFTVKAEATAGLQHTYMVTYTHTHTCTCTHTHGHTHMDTHTWTHTYTHARMKTSMCTLTHAHMHTGMHASIQAGRQTHKHACMQVCTHISGNLTSNTSRGHSEKLSLHFSVPHHIEDVHPAQNNLEIRMKLNCHQKNIQIQIQSPSPIILIYREDQKLKSRKKVRYYC